MAGRTALATREILERLSRRPRAQSALGREEKSVQGTSGAPSLIVGLGATGVSVARYLAALGERVRVIGDVELFARAANAPVIAVTGSNGKSTVATLAAEMLGSQGLIAPAGGNL